MKPGPKPRPGPRENNGRLKRDGYKSIEPKVPPTPERLCRGGIEGIPMKSAFKDQVWITFTRTYLRSIAQGKSI